MARASSRRLRADEPQFADGDAALAEVGLHDPDARVSQMAFLALAEIPSTRAVDALLGKAALNEAWDIGIYAAYASARHGDRSMIARIVKELGNTDKRARFSAAWLLGQIGSPRPQ